MNFRRALRKAAQQAFSDGTISREERRRIHVGVFFRRDRCAQAEAAVIGFLKAEGDISESQGWDDIDWAALIEAIIKLIEYILALFT
jgi:hypothetical protein